MAKSRQSLVQDKIVDMTECSICAEIFTNPKILPCVHTFCLGCLETYGKDKQPGEQIACPLCRTKLLIPAGGLCNLPNNFFIGKMVEIGKLAATPVNEATCNVCPEGEEALANMYCIDCEQNLCERCSKSHKRTKFTQNHQIVELGGRATAQELNFCNSYCDHHPNELVKMYCYDDKEAICLICCVESHQSHRCVNVGKAAEEFTKRLKDDLKMMNNRLPECGEIVEKLDRYKAGFLGEILNAEKSARDIGNKLKALVDRHTEILINNLKSLSEMKVKAFETTKQDVERFKVMVDSYSRFCEELLSRGSPVDICRTANQMQTRAAELESLPVNCSGDCLRYETVLFHPSSIEDILKQTRTTNVIGEIIVIESPDRNLKFEIERIVAERFLSLESFNILESKYPVWSSEWNNIQTAKQVDEYLERQEKAEVEHRTVQVHGVDSLKVADFIVGLMRNRRRGGGEVESDSFDADSGILTVQFKDKKFADHFLAQKSILMLGKSYDIHAPGKEEESTKGIPLEEVDECKNREAEEASRTVEVHGVRSQEVAKDIVDLLENKRRGGGPVVKHFLNESNHILTVQFEDKTYAEHFLRKEVLSAFGVSYYVKLPLSSDVQVRISRTADKKPQTWETLTRKSLS